MGRAVFFYSYRPAVPSFPDDGGFTVNLFDDNYLEFTTYHINREVKENLRFAVPPYVCMKYKNCVEGVKDWFNQVPPVMRAGRDTQFAYTAQIGIDGYREILLEDFDALMRSPFRSARAHYARKLYNLLEDISTILNELSFELEPNRFMWDMNRIQPIRSNPISYSTYA